MKTTLSITGMHCASCGALITRTLKKTKGVEDANVNLAAAKAQITFDPAAVDEEQLVRAVKAAGYGADVRHDHDRGGHQHGIELDRKRREEEVNGYRTKFLIALARRREPAQGNGPRCVHDHGRQRARPMPSRDRRELNTCSLKSCPKEKRAK